jgi:hypothetical protein
MKAIYYKKFRNIVESGAKHHKPKLLESYNPKSHKSDIIHNGKTTTEHYSGEHQGRIEDFKLEGGRTKKKLNFWGISCEKSRFYDKKSYFYQLRIHP